MTGQLSALAWMYMGVQLLLMGEVYGVVPWTYVSVHEGVRLTDEFPLLVYGRSVHRAFSSVHFGHRTPVASNTVSESRSVSTGYQKVPTVQGLAANKDRSTPAHQYL